MAKGASYTVKKTKTRYNFTYSGDLAEAIAKAKRDLQREMDNPDIQYWSWLKEKAEKAINAHNTKIQNITAFIDCAEEHLKKQQTEDNKE